MTGHVQKGPDRAKIRVWNYKSLVLHKVIKKMHDAAVQCCQWSAASGYLYTVGAQEMHKCVMWNGADLFKLDKKSGLDHEEVLSADVTSKKKNFVNGAVDMVSDVLLGKQDILGLELNPALDAEDEAGGLIDEFVVFGRKNVKYYSVRSRVERRNGRSVELVVPAGKTLVMSKLGGKSSEYERVYHSCCWLAGRRGYYLVGGHAGTLYICCRQACLKKVGNLGLSGQVGCMANYVENTVLVACWDGKLVWLNVAGVEKLKLRKHKERTILIPRSGDEESGLRTQSPRSMVLHEAQQQLLVGLRTNQIIALSLDELFEEGKQQEQGQLHATRLVVDAHYGSVSCLAAHPTRPFFVTGSDDSTLRIWDARGAACLSRFKFDDKERPSFLRFSHSGLLLAVGLTTSKIVVLAWDKGSLSEVKAVVQMPFKIDAKKLKRSQQLDARNSDFSTEITVIKWAPDDGCLAAGHIDAIAHLFSIEINEEDSEVVVTPWPQSLCVSNGLVDVQWSADGQWLLSLSKDQDLMVWFLDRERRAFEHYLYWLDPDRVRFHGDPLLAGWDTEGVFQSYVGWDGTDLNCLSLTQQKLEKTSPVHELDVEKERPRQTRCRLLASADNKGYIRVHNYPALREAAHHYYSGHANQVASVQWTAGDEFLVSVGGADRSVFQWRLTSQPTDYIRKYKPLKSTNQFKK